MFALPCIYFVHRYIVAFIYLQVSACPEKDRMFADIKKADEGATKPKDLTDIPYDRLFGVNNFQICMLCELIAISNISSAYISINIITF